VYVYERVLLQPVPTSALSEEEVIEGVPVQTSEAVAVPAEGNEVGLQLRAEPGGQKVNVGAVVLTI
jgi:hypothetical protein